MIDKLKTTMQRRAIGDTFFFQTFHHTTHFYEELCCNNTNASKKENLLHFNGQIDKCSIFHDYTLPIIMHCIIFLSDKEDILFKPMECLDCCVLHRNVFERVFVE
jgi:hypothetical protein